MYYFINEGEYFISVSKHKKTDESTRPKAECFYCFRVTVNTKTERPRKNQILFSLFRYRICIVVGQCYERYCVFSQLRLLIKNCRTLHWRPHLQF